MGAGHEHDLDEVAAQFDTLLAGAPLGIGVFDRECRHVRVNPVLAEMNGRPAAELAGLTPGEVNGEVGREAEALYRRVMDEGTPMHGVRLVGEVSARPGDVRHWDLSFHPVRSTGATAGRAGADPAGEEVLGLCVVVDDVTAEMELRERLDASTRRLAEVTESMAVGYLAMDAAWRITYVNEQAVTALGRQRDDLVGGVIWELFPQTAGTAFEAGYRRARDTGQPVTFDAYYPPPLDRWYEVRAAPEADGVALYFLDITVRVAAQRAAETAAARAQVLAEVSRTLSARTEALEALVALPRLLVPVVADWCVVAALDGAVPPTEPPARRRSTPAGAPPHDLHPVAEHHRDPARADELARYARGRLQAAPTAPAGAAGPPHLRALLGRRPVVVTEDAASAVLAGLPPGPPADAAAALAPAAVVEVPVVVRGHVVGTLGLGWDAPPPTVDGGASPAEELGLDPVATRTALVGSGPDDGALSLVDAVVDRVGTALEAIAAGQRQREIAEELQRSLLTAPPEPDHAHVVVRYVPAAEAAQVGGDWYDAFIQPPGSTVLVIGDVLGHDVGAAAAMGQVRTLVRAAAVMGHDGPADVLRVTDAAMRVLEVSTTATAVVLRLEQQPEHVEAGTTVLRWSNAGHPPPLVLSPDHAVAALGSRTAEGVAGVAGDARRHHDLLLGVDPGTARHDETQEVPRGTTVLLYTDGLVERRGESLAVGLERLATTVRDVSEAQGRGDVPPGLDALCDEVLSRVLPGRPTDDVALVAVRLHPQDRPRPAEAGPHRTPDWVPEEPEVLAGAPADPTV